MANSATTSEQLCYIPCNFCNIVLAVSVPCSSLFDIVTVRCGHCTNLWSVNMAAALQSLSRPNFQATNYALPEYGSSSRSHAKIPSRISNRINTTEQRVVNRPPEKRQRVPSAYNQFIKEEIKRIKANNPDISHREAFSTAAKNLAVGQSEVAKRGKGLIKAPSKNPKMVSPVKTPEIAPVTVKTENELPWPNEIYSLQD